MLEAFIAILLILAATLGVLLVTGVIRWIGTSEGKANEPFSLLEAKGLMALFGGTISDVSIEDYLPGDFLKIPSTISPPTNTLDFYLAIFDQSSPVNVAGMNDKAWAYARRKGGIAKRQVNYEDYWQAERDPEAIALWSILNIGFYKIGVRVLPAEPARDYAKANGFCPLLPEEKILSFPSGNLMFASPHQLGDPNLPIVVKIKPGRYRIGLFSHFEVESKHQGLEKSEDYIDQPTPDWDILLQPLP